MFHGESFLRRIDATPGCRQLGLECGHWVQHQQAAIVLSETKKFMESSTGANAKS